MLARSTRLGRLAIIFAGASLVASVAAAQFGRGVQGAQAGLNRRNPRYTRIAVPEDFDGSFQFCRVIFRTVPHGDGGDWSVDWPRADENLSTRLSELTRTPVGLDSTGAPNSVLVRLSDPIISHCGFMMMTEVGNIGLDEAEVTGLRNYLLKGGFLWADDFWGEYAWSIWEGEIRKVFPAASYPIIDVPLDNPIFHEMMTVSSIPQIPSIGVWEQYRVTSERGLQSATPHVRAILDDHGRIMVLITHNTDFGDAYERESEDHEYFEKFSVPGYAFGVNVLLYSMTH